MIPVVRNQTRKAKVEGYPCLSSQQSTMKWTRSKPSSGSHFFINGSRVGRWSARPVAEAERGATAAGCPRPAPTSPPPRTVRRPMVTVGRGGTRGRLRGQAGLGASSACKGLAASPSPCSGAGAACRVPGQAAGRPDRVRGRGVRLCGDNIGHRNCRPSSALSCAFLNNS